MVDAREERRMQVVEEHLRCENAHDLAGVLATFGETALYEETAWGERHEGVEGVRRYYEGLLAGLPDLRIEEQKRHVTCEHVILEVVISGTHRATWRGLPATGRRVEFPLCAVYSFTDDDKLAGERIYYDRATVFRQLGIYREPGTLLGAATMALCHPWTTARAAIGRITSRP